MRTATFTPACKQMRTRGCNINKHEPGRTVINAMIKFVDAQPKIKPNWP